MPEPCGAPPRRFLRGGQEWIETCARTARVWTAEKNGHTAELIRCDQHAAELRGKGYDVRLAKAAPKPKWDMTSPNSAESAAEWLRKQSGAVMVLVIRAEHSVVAVDKGVEPEDVETLLRYKLQEAVARLRETQAAAAGGNHA